MPTPSCMSIQCFMHKYNNYKNSSSYAASWLQSIVDLGAEIQADCNYATGLSSDEKTALQANIDAATGCVITPVS